MNSTLLTDELTGKTGIATDHGVLGFGDLVVLLLDAILLIYTGWRSFDFLNTTIPTSFQMLAIVGLWGLDIGALAWSLVWIFGSSETYQDWTSMAFFVIDLLGVATTSLTDSLMYSAKGGAMTGTLTGLATVLIPLIIFGNVVAGFIYHLTSPATKARREKRKADAAHNARMREISAMERDLMYAEQYLLAKQETLEKSVVLADIKTAQDAVEKETRAKLHDQLGIHNQAAAGAGNVESTLSQLRQRLLSLKAQINSSPSANDNPTDPDQRREQTPSVPSIVGLPTNSDNSFPSHNNEPVMEKIPTPSDFAEAAKKNGNSHHPDPFH